MPIPPATTTTTTTTTDEEDDGPGTNILFIKKSNSNSIYYSKSYSVKYGTLTCADGFISLDIYSKDVMLMVSFGIFILQGKNIFVEFQTSLNLFQQLVVLLWDWSPVLETTEVKMDGPIMFN